MSPAVFIGSFLSEPQPISKEESSAAKMLVPEHTGRRGCSPRMFSRTTMVLKQFES